MSRCLSLLFVLLAPTLVQAQNPLAPMKFNEVREIAPGVFFRFSSISPDDSVPFGGSNNIWIVFKDYVVVYDANFPKEAGDVIAAVRKTTNKPIRYVLDSHHHGDHAYGNAIWAKEGASIVASANCARLLRVDGPKEFADAGKGPTGRKDIAASFLKVPDLIFDEKLVLDDGTQRVEFIIFGHGHTAGDAVAWLPKHKILCTGDACVNGPYNYTGHSDTVSWIRCLEKFEQWDIQLICPGHGLLASKGLLSKQKRYFIELRQQVAKGLAAGKSVADIQKDLDIPWYREWTTVAANERKENIQHVYDELTGRTKPWDLFEEYGLYEGPSPTKLSKGWTAPKRIVIPNLMPARLAELKRIAPEVYFVPVKTAEDAAREAADADAVLGFCTADIVRAGGTKLRWIQVSHAGVEKDLSPAVVKSSVVLTNTARVYGPNVADQALALLLTLTRGIRTGNPKLLTPPDKNIDLFKTWNQLKPGEAPAELNHRTMLVVGLGGIGTQIAKRAHGFGMRVMAIDPNQAIVRPDFVFSIDPPAKLQERLPQADVVVLACPLTDQTKGLMGAKQFAAMKPSAYFINIGRGGLVRTPALVTALQEQKLAGAGLDVTDPEPLPGDHPLWKLPNVAISPHQGGQSAGARERQWRLWRENVRRFVAGERLLCVVDKQKGY